MWCQSASSIALRATPTLAIDRPGRSVPCSRVAGFSCSRIRSTTRSIRCALPLLRKKRAFWPSPTRMRLLRGMIGGITWGTLDFGAIVICRCSLLCCPTPKRNAKACRGVAWFVAPAGFAEETCPHVSTNVPEAVTFIRLPDETKLAELRVRELVKQTCGRKAVAVPVFLLGNFGRMSDEPGTAAMEINTF